MKLWQFSSNLFSCSINYRNFSCHALCSSRRLCFCFSRAYYARCSLWMTSSIYTRKWSINVLYCCLCSHFPWTLLRILPITPNSYLSTWSSYFPCYDGNSLSWVCSSLRTNEFLRSNRNYKPFLCFPYCRTIYRRVNVRRFFCR